MSASPPVTWEREFLGCSPVHPFTGSCERRAVLIGMALFDPGQRREAFGGLAERIPEALRVLYRFLDLPVHFGDRLLVAFLLGEVAELRIHFGVFVGFARDRHFESPGRRP